MNSCKLLDFPIPYIVCQISLCMLSHATSKKAKSLEKNRLKLKGGSWHTKQHNWKIAPSCHTLVLRGSLPLPCLHAGGVSVCTGLCQLTLICLISTSKSLTSPHANKHIQSSFKPKLLSNTCLISRGLLRQFIMHLKKKGLAPALQGENTLLPGFYVITLTFSLGLEIRLGCMCVWESY